MAPFDGLNPMPLVTQAATGPQAKYWVRHDLLPALWRVIEGIMAGKIARRFRLAIDIDIAITGICPPLYRPAALRVVDELVTNAVEHAVDGDECGRIIVTVDSRPEIGVLVTVSDTGRGFSQGDRVEGNGLRLLRMLVEVSVRCGQDHCTVQCRFRVSAGCPSRSNRPRPRAAV